MHVKIETKNWGKKFALNSYKEPTLIKNENKGLIKRFFHQQVNQIIQKVKRKMWFK